MSVRVLEAGLQTTVQGLPRAGQRHLGVPRCGPADPLSMALANKMVGNGAFVAALETTLTGVQLEFQAATVIAIAGADAECRLNDAGVEQHSSIAVSSGDILAVGAATKGVRNYIAFSGGLKAEKVLDSDSTYLPAAIGGHKGRALQDGDELAFKDPVVSAVSLQTPIELRVPMSSSWTIRATSCNESTSLCNAEKFFESKLRVTNRNNRMGIVLDGESFYTNVEGDMPSAAVFPGTIQCPGDGKLLMLSVDAQTSGGYPRIAKVTRTDLHILGQLRTGDRLTFIERDGRLASEELRDKHLYWQGWLPDIACVI